MGQDDRAVVGILGGMGPWATLDLFRRILELTPAERDQDHLHIIIENNPAVPERTAAILGRGESPLPMLIEGARRLAAAGADFIVMPCNTAHHWIDELTAAIDVPFIDMVSEAVAATLHGEKVSGTFCAKHPPGLSGKRYLTPFPARVGLLATTGTIQSGVYDRRFAERGVTVLRPDEATQRDLVMGAIFGPTGIKAAFGGSSSSAAFGGSSLSAGHPDEANRQRLAEAARRLVEAGAQALVAACTEIPLVLRQADVSVPLVDTLDCLARAAVKRAKRAERV